MKGFGARLRSFVVGCALTPTAVLAASASFRSLAALAGRRVALPFIAGLSAYPLVHWLLQPVGFYVLGHELTHSAAAVLTGSRIKSMQVSSEGGRVVLDKSNAFIALAPYVIPLYTILWIAGFRLISIWRPLPGWALAAGVGAALSFHFVHTVGILWSEHQTDLDHAGGVFSSLSLILLANSLVLAVVLRCLYPGHLSLRSWAATVALGTGGFWRAAGRAGLLGASWASAHLPRRTPA